MNTPNQWGLTDRQYECMELLSQGLMNEEIAQALHISRESVKTHLTKAYTRLRVSSRIQAGRVFMEAGLPSTLQRQINEMSRRVAYLEDQLSRINHYRSVAA